MTEKIFALFVQLIQSYLFIISAALIAGLVVPDRMILLAPFTTLFLQIIFFFTSLKMDLKHVFNDIKDIKMILLANAFMLLVLPAVIFIIAHYLVPSMAISLLLLAAMPVGMTVPLLVEVMGGKPSIALALTISSALLAPFTIPIVISIFASTAVTVSGLTMFWSLTKVILIPFAFAQGIRWFLHDQIKATYFTFKPISLILLGFLIAGTVAKQASVIVHGLGFLFFFQLFILTLFLCILLYIGFHIAYWRTCSERITVSISVTFMNFTLAIFLAGEFFHDPNVLLATVLVIFPWTLIVIPFKRIVNMYICPIPSLAKAKK